VLDVQEMIAWAGIESTTISDADRRLCQAALLVLGYDDIMWQKFEDFNRDYFALRLALARHKGKHESISLSELLKGARVGQPVAEHRVLLEASLSRLGTVSILSKRYPSDEALVRGIVYHNAGGAPFDLVTILGMAPEDGDGSCLTVLHECKHTAGPYGARRLDAKLVRSVLKEAQVNHGDASSSHHKYAVVVMSNCPVAEGSAEQVAKMCASTPLVLVTRDHAIDYFGPTLASRFLGYAEP
jgi:hypothetical protein